ncbi:MAG: hypothetical protein FJX72_10220 [Armatimonadetes bacterium]|nr:hypothetical protein [Armatimonadota bacterium]
MNDSDGDLDPKVVAKLRSKKAEEREAAKDALDRLGPRVVDELLAVLAKESAGARRRRNIGIGLIVGYMALVMVLVLTSNTEQIATYIGLISSVGVMFAASQIQKNAAGELAEHDDLRVVGPLAEALEYDDKDTVAGAERSLIKLLPRLQATDYALLSHEQRRCLDRSLIKKSGSPLKHAILSAYEQIGDEQSVVVVEKLASGQHKTIRDAAVLKHAADSLPAIRAGSARVKAAQTLLRPAFADGADMLLRPVEAAPTGPVELLLRPACEADDAPIAQPEAATEQSLAQAR